MDANGRIDGGRLAGVAGWMDGMDGSAKEGEGGRYVQARRIV